MGPSLCTLNKFGPLIFSLLEAENLYYFLRFQSFALFWAMVQHGDFFGPQHLAPRTRGLPAAYT